MISPGRCNVPKLGVLADAPPVLEWPALPKVTSVPQAKPVVWHTCSAATNKRAQQLQQLLIFHNKSHNKATKMSKKEF